MKFITFIDAEIDKKSGKIFDVGSIKEDGKTFHSYYKMYPMSRTLKKVY